MLRSSDATAAYRGYRLQMLYTLFRILECDSKKFIFQLEELEDLSIKDENGNVLEVIQVKSGNTNLLLSTFKKSFFQRIQSAIKINPITKIIIVSFSNVGCEFRKAIENEGHERTTVAKKLKENYDINSEKEAKIILEKLQLDVLDEKELTEKIYTYLKEIMTGIDPKTAFDIFNYWLYVCAEKKCSITKNDIINKITGIGRFLAETDAHNREWFRSIEPLDDQEIELDEDKLHEEFYHGISAKYVHILAKTDILRPDKIQELNTKFNDSSIVIIHGASGQGKTTLAYRYLHDYFPNNFRFKIKFIEDKKHVFDIATAIAGHAKAIGIPIIIYIDVVDRKKEWIALIDELSIHKNIKILITIREEDYRSANIQDNKITFKDVDLIFNKAEAEEIYKSLKKTKIPPQFLKFEEAWNKFGANGPLLEFVYLVTQGESLHKTLKTQLNKISDEIREGKRNSKEIDLLKFVSVASAFDAQLKVKPLIDYLKLCEPKRTIELFEKEYFLRLSHDGSLIGAVHPIRSKIMSDIFTDNAVDPWSKYAVECLPWIFENDVEIFLLNSFLKRKEDTEPILTAINEWNPISWTVIGGIVRALIWIGIYEYVELNRNLIDELFKKHGMGFQSIIDYDIADAMPDSKSNMLSFFKVNESEIEKYRSRQIDKSQIFNKVKNWLETRQIEPCLPNSNEDWLGIAETSFWIGRFKINSSIDKTILFSEIEKEIENLPLEILADVILGLYHGFTTDFDNWKKNQYTKIIKRFREDTLNIAFYEKEDKIIAHFLINSWQENYDYQHAEIMKKIQLLRRIFPNKLKYECEGYGTERILNTEIISKKIEISNLPLKWLTTINSIFRGLAIKPYRLAIWKEYAESILEFRKENLDAIKYLNACLIRYFKIDGDTIVENLVEPKIWDRYIIQARKNILLPMCVVDEWGYFDEISDVNVNEYATKSLALIKPFLDSFSKYRTSLNNFFKQSIHGIALNLIRGKRHPADKEKAEEFLIKKGIKPIMIRISIHNLYEVIINIKKIQILFENNFIDFFDKRELIDFNKKEFNEFYNLWNLWYKFCFDPNFTDVKPLDTTIKKRNKIKNDIKSNIERILKTYSSEDISISVSSYKLIWDNTPAFWIRIDSKKEVDFFTLSQQLIHKIFQLLNTSSDKDFYGLIFTINWPLIIIIPQLHGKCLTNLAYRINSINHLFESAEYKLNYINLLTTDPINLKSLNELDIKTWNSKELKIRNSSIENIYTLHALLDKLVIISNNLSNLEFDEHGEEILKKYFEENIVALFKFRENYVEIKHQKMKESIEMLHKEYNFPPWQEYQKMGIEEYMANSMIRIQNVIPILNKIYWDRIEDILY